MRSKESRRFKNSKVLKSLTWSTCILKSPVKIRLSNLVQTKITGLKTLKKASIWKLLWRVIEC
uniref:Uncharacterized protein n=1 Tax=Anguilla anguilla TaxID=7936 RepID=A0A0E9RRV3_ANGAN